MQLILLWFYILLRCSSGINDVDEIQRLFSNKRSMYDDTNFSWTAPSIGGNDYIQPRVHNPIRLKKQRIKHLFEIYGTLLNFFFLYKSSFASVL